MGSWKCPYCGSTNGSRSCPGCGCMQQDVPEPKEPIGHYCGEPIYDRAEWIRLGGAYEFQHVPGMVMDQMGYIPPWPEPDGRWIGGKPSTDWVGVVFFGAIYAGCIALLIATLIGKLG